MAQSTEVLGPDGLSRLDLDADHGAGRMFQHHVHLHLIAVTVMKELHWLFGPGELARDLADREVLQQRSDRGHRILGALLRHADEPSAQSGVRDDQFWRGYCARGHVR